MKSLAGEHLVEAAQALARGLAAAGAPHMLIGGLAVIARGLPRTTVDVDATVHLGDLGIETLLDTLARHGIVARGADTLEFARRHQVLKLRHAATQTPIDVSLAWLPFELEAIERAEAVDFGGLAIPTVTADDLIIYKAVAWRDRDRDDIRRLLVMYRRTADFERIRDTVRQFAEALDQPERLSELDLLVEQARG